MLRAIRVMPALLGAQRASAMAFFLAQCAETILVTTLTIRTLEARFAVWFVRTDSLSRLAFRIFVSPAARYALHVRALPKTALRQLVPKTSTF
jgi:hypothetical protein